MMVDVPRRKAFFRPQINDEFLNFRRGDFLKVCALKIGRDVLGSIVIERNRFRLVFAILNTDGKEKKNVLLYS